MADVVKATDQLRHVFTECIALEKTKGALGKKFHQAVIMLLNENPTVHGKELAKMFLETMTTVENAATAELVAAFGEDATIKEHMGSWTQYKSNYKRALEKCHRDEILKTNGPGQLNTLLNETRNALNERDGGNNDDGSGEAGDSTFPKGSKGRSGYNKLPDELKAKLDNAVWMLGKLDTAAAEKVIGNFERATWAEANGRTGTKRGKVAGAAGASGGAADKASA